MSTKIIENFNQLCYTVCFIFFTASAAKNRTIRPKTKPVNTFLEIIFRKLITTLFTGFLFYKKHNQTSYTIHTYKKRKTKASEMFFLTAF